MIPEPRCCPSSRHVPPESCPEFDSLFVTLDRRWIFLESLVGQIGTLLDLKQNHALGELRNLFTIHTSVIHVRVGDKYHYMTFVHHGPKSWHDSLSPFVGSSTVVTHSPLSMDGRGCVPLIGTNFLWD